jgi:hypothetical protein
MIIHLSSPSTVDSTGLFHQQLITLVRSNISTLSRVLSLLMDGVSFLLMPPRATIDGLAAVHLPCASSQIESSPAGVPVWGCTSSFSPACCVSLSKKKLIGATFFSGVILCTYEWHALNAMAKLLLLLCYNHICKSHVNCSHCVYKL